MLRFRTASAWKSGESPRKWHFPSTTSGASPTSRGSRSPPAEAEDVRASSTAIFELIDADARGRHDGHRADGARAGRDASAARGSGHRDRPACALSRRVGARRGTTASTSCPKSSSESTGRLAIAELSRALAEKRVSSVGADPHARSTASTLLNPPSTHSSPSIRERALAAAQGGGRPHRRRRRRSADRHPGRAQGRADDRGAATTCGSRMLDRFRRAVRRLRGRAPGRGGHGARRQDQHGRVRDGLVERDLPLRPGEKSVEPRVRARRQLRRLGGSRRGAPRAGSDRHRHRRLDPPAGGAVRGSAA